MPRQVNFHSIWRTNSNLNKLLDKNIGLSSIFWISKDFDNGDNSLTANPHAKLLKTIRNYLEHRFTNITLNFIDVNKDKLLILDEPTNGLDPLGIQELRDLIRSFPEKGITVILSSHILAEVEHTADHIGIIHDGELKYQNIIDHNENLEELFMDVVKNGKRV